MATAQIHITLKPTLLDAQGSTVLKALQQLGHRSVRDVRIGKHIQVQLDDTLSVDEQRAQLETMCQQLLANPVVEDYSIILDGAPQSSTHSAVSGATVVASDVVPQARTGASPATHTVLSASDSVAVPTMQTASPTTQVVPVDDGLLGATTISDPFGVSFETYNSLSTDDKLTLQGRAWEQHGTWISNELSTRRAGWILCVGGQVLASGDTLESYPSDAQIVTLGTQHDLAPFVFSRPPQQ
jgi:phosphoribosylformylglycinamidine synthase